MGLTKFIFYPGGKVEHTAYEPLLEALAAEFYGSGAGGWLSCLLWYVWRAGRRRYTNHVKCGADRAGNENCCGVYGIGQWSAITN